MVGLPGLFYAGVCGLEMDLNDGRATHPGAVAARDRLRALAHLLGALTADFPGAWVEDKGLGLTLHYRQVSAHRRQRLLEQAGKFVGTHGDGVHVIQGPMAWEITPAVGWNKGSAVRVILGSVGQPVVPLYAGDGANDVEALAEVAVAGGVAVGIGPCAPHTAHFRLQDPAALLTLLARLGGSLANPSDRLSS